MKKILAGFSFALLFAVALPASAATTWDVSGTYNINVNYLSVDYPEKLILTQSGTTITGVSLDTIPPASLFTVTGGSVIGNDINIDANQGSLLIHMVGIIAPDGSMGGTWADIAPGTRAGTWITTSGAANALTSACNGSTFDSFTLGSVNGQGGWSSTGVYDQEIVDNTYGYTSFGCKTLRISDAVTSGAFGDQTFSPSLANEAGETDALNGGMSGGVRQNHFEAQFDLASTMSTLQPGMHLSVSPDRGDGARMSYLRFEDGDAGINVFFDDVQGTNNPSNFVETQIATGLSLATPHTVKFVMDFVDGPSNDVVRIYIDSVLVHTGTSWENYYRFDSESSTGNNSRTVDSLLFRESGDSTPGDAGNGYLIDNFSSSSLVNNLLCPAAPSIAASLLKINNVKAKSATNYISSVAHQMNPQTDFNNVHACDLAAYRDAVNVYLHTNLGAY